MAAQTPQPGPRFWIALGLTAFGLNWAWEMAQMSAFAEMAGRPWWETLWPCALAALGDVALTAAACGVGGLAADSISWPAAGRWNVYLTTAVLGAVSGAAFEWYSQATGRWSYSGRMPVVPVLGVGLWPLLQLTLTIPASLWAARRWGYLRPAGGVREASPGRGVGPCDGTPDGVRSSPTEFDGRLDPRSFGSACLPIRPFSQSRVERLMNAIRLVLAVAIGVVAGCQNPADTKPGGTAEEKEYDIKGKVTAVAPDKSSVTLDHEEIPGFMKAMEMKYQVSDPRILEGIAAGDNVSGRLKAKGTTYTIIRLEKAAAPR